MCFGEPEPLQGQNWADARRLSPRWNHCNWRDLSPIMYALGIAGSVGFGGCFLRLGTSLPSFPCPLLQIMRGVKAHLLVRVTVVKAFSIQKVRLHK